jgi:hypothetical protein
MEFLSKKDTFILRGEEAAAYGSRFAVRAVLIDSVGSFVFSFDGDWTDAQIHHALMFVNSKHDEIVRFGELRARNKIKAALGIDT